MRILVKKNSEDNSPNPIATYADTIVDFRNVGWDVCSFPQTVPAALNTSKPFRLLKI